MWQVLSAAFAWPIRPAGKYSARIAYVRTEAPPRLAIIDHSAMVDTRTSATSAISAAINNTVAIDKASCARIPRRRKLLAQTPRISEPALSATAITNKWLTIAEGDRPSTSSIHGDAQSPCSAHAVLMHMVESGARHQNLRSRKTNPRFMAPDRALSAEAEWGTTTNVTMAHSAVSTASSSNRPRQPIHASNHSVGAVAATAPSAPTITKQPLNRARRSRGNHSTIALNPAMTAEPAPIPIKTRASTRLQKLSPMAKSAAPAEATNRSTLCTRRGP